MPIIVYEVSKYWNLLRQYMLTYFPCSLFISHVPTSKLLLLLLPRLYVFLSKNCQQFVYFKTRWPIIHITHLAYTFKSFFFSFYLSTRIYVDGFKMSHTAWRQRVDSSDGFCPCIIKILHIRSIATKFLFLQVKAGGGDMFLLSRGRQE